MAHRNIVRTSLGNVGRIVGKKGKLILVRFPNGNVMSYLKKDVQVIDITR